jgi:hypothetical protein
MVDDERGPYSCDKASLKVSSICDNGRGPLKSNLGALEFYWGAQRCDKVK